MKKRTQDQPDLIAAVNHWRPKRVVVAGDFMLDRHVLGNAQRLSPDAPVPVLAVDKVENFPGGASNVCFALRALRCDVACLGVVGVDHPLSLSPQKHDADFAGQYLRRRLADEGCDTTGLLTADDRPTTVKFNLVGLAQHRHPQKMFRVDAESRAAVPRAVEDRLISAARKVMRGAGALCLEDYHKGVLTPRVCRELIALAKKHRVPVLVDPAAIDDYGKYAGASIITPNRTEAALATATEFGSTSDMRVLHAMARTLRTKHQLDAVLLTLDKQGVLLLEGKAKPLHIPAQVREVYDVTGAGDMVLAMLAAAVATGHGWATASRLANVAAGLEVEKFGVVPIPLDEVLLKLLADHHAGGKRWELADLLPALHAHRHRGRRVVFTNGCFDILHAGHVHYLRAARALGDLLVVGLNSDASVRRLKGPTRPVNSVDDRALILGELACVDHVVVFNEDTPIKLIEAIVPDVLVKGADYTRDTVVGADVVEKHGGRVELIPLVPGRSTTGILEKAQKEGGRGRRALRVKKPTA